jgi:hypothetical protein
MVKVNLELLKTLLAEIIVEQATREYSGREWQTAMLNDLDNAIPRVKDKNK